MYSAESPAPAPAEAAGAAPAAARRAGPQDAPPSGTGYRSLVAFACVSIGALLACALCWTNGADAGARYLGGLAPVASRLFSWHVLLMVAAFCCFSMQLFSPFTHQTHSGGLLRESYYYHCWYHHLWALASVLCLAAGLTAIYINKNQKSSHRATLHFNSMHSQVGILFIVAVLLRLFLISCSKRGSPYITFVEEVGYAIAVAAVVAGIAEKNIHLACKCAAPFTDSALSCINNLPVGCKLSNGMGVLAMSAFVAVICIRRLYRSGNSSSSNNCSSTYSSYSSSSCIGKDQPLTQEGDEEKGGTHQERVASVMTGELTPLLTK
jgi:hypothetical protein